jgi:Lon-like protease
MKIAALSIAGVLAVLSLADWLLTSTVNKYILLPDHPHPAAAVITVGGIKPTPTADGAGIYYLDVLVHQASLPESWLARFEHQGTVLPADEIVPPGGSQADLDRVDRLDFEDSRVVAGVVALRALGRKVEVKQTGVTFEGVEDSAPAAHDGLRPGMVITAVDGVATPTVPALRAQLKGRKVGSPIRLSVLDGSRKREIDTQMTSDPQNAQQAIIGVLGVEEAPPKVKLPVRVTISPRGLGRGPSAGLAFTLEVYDTLTGHRLAHGRRIAVTGTIDLNGDVGPIGGVRQKVLGAVAKGVDMVIVPQANAADARAAADGRVVVKAVSSFRQALTALGAKLPPAGSE